jgi:phosphopantothenate---cysteine ligase (CTP)
MRCLVTCGPTYEPLDDVRRLTNFSTGKLGTELANYLADRGHYVLALRGFYTTWRGTCRANMVQGFTTTQDLADQLKHVSGESWDTVFHVAAVSDFRFGSVFRKDERGQLQKVVSEKFGTREGTLFAELIPTPKIIASMRSYFPKARIFGWKFEVEGTREDVLHMGQRQILENRTDYCVVNGPAYGAAYGILGAGEPVIDCPAPQDLYKRLEELARRSRD